MNLREYLLLLVNLVEHDREALELPVMQGSPVDEHDYRTVNVSIDETYRVVDSRGETVSHFTNEDVARDFVEGVMYTEKCTIEKVKCVVIVGW